MEYCAVADIFLAFLVMAWPFDMLSARWQASRAAYAVTAKIVYESRLTGLAACHRVTTIAHLFWSVKEVHPVAVQLDRKKG